MQPSLPHLYSFFPVLFPFTLSFLSLLHFHSVSPPGHFQFLCISPLWRFVGRSLRVWAVFHTLNCKVHSVPSARHSGILVWHWHATRPTLCRLCCGQLAMQLIVESFVLWNQRKSSNLNCLLKWKAIVMSMIVSIHRDNTFCQAIFCLFYHDLFFIPKAGPKWESDVRAVCQMQ